MADGPAAVPPGRAPRRPRPIISAPGA